MGYFRWSVTLIVILIAAAWSASAQGHVENVRWNLVELNGMSVKSTTVFIRLDEDSKRLSGNATCNQIMGSYTLTGSAFMASDIGSTKRACLGLRKQQTEQAFIKALGAATRYGLKGNELVLYEGDSPIMRFRSSDAGSGTAASGLKNRKWELRTIDGEEVGLASDLPHITFQTGKRTNGRGGCNSFSGEYKMLGSSLTISKVISTMMACTREDRATIEQSFYRRLQKARTFEVSGDKLEIVGDEGKLEFRAVE